MIIYTAITPKQQSARCMKHFDGKNHLNSLWPPDSADKVTGPLLIPFIMPQFVLYQ